MSDPQIELAVLRQRLDDQQEHLRALAPVAKQIAVLEERAGGIQTGLNDARDHIERVETACEKQASWTKDQFQLRDERARERDERTRKDQIALRIALGGLFVTFAGLIVAVLTLLGQH